MKKVLIGLSGMALMTVLSILLKQFSTSRTIIIRDRVADVRSLVLALWTHFRIWTAINLLASISSISIIFSTNFSRLLRGPRLIFLIGRFPSERHSSRSCMMMAVFVNTRIVKGRKTETMCRYQKHQTRSYTLLWRSSLGSRR